MWIQKIIQNMRELIEPNCNAILEHILYVPLFGRKIEVEKLKKTEKNLEYAISHTSPIQSSKIPPPTHISPVYHHIDRQALRNQQISAAKCLCQP